MVAYADAERKDCHDTRRLIRAIWPLRIELLLHSVFDDMHVYEYKWVCASIFLVGYRMAEEALLRKSQNNLGM